MAHSLGRRQKTGTTDPLYFSVMKAFTSGDVRASFNALISSLVSSPFLTTRTLAKVLAARESLASEARASAAAFSLASIA